MTHAMIHRLEVVRGKPESAIPLVKHAVRLARRIRRHRIHHAVFPCFVRTGDPCCRVEVGTRIVTLMDDGSCHPSLLRDKNNSGDHCAMNAHHNRVHAIYMQMAAQSRAMRWYAAVRIDLLNAKEERNREL